MTQVQYLETSKQKELEQALSSGCTDTWQSVSIHGQVLSCVEYIMYLNIIFCVNQVLYSHVDTPASVLLFPVHQVLLVSLVHQVVLNGSWTRGTEDEYPIHHVYSTVILHVYQVMYCPVLDIPDSVLACVGYTRY